MAVKKKSVKPVRPAVKKAVQPSLGEVVSQMKMLIGQQKGMLTWLSKERAALQELVAKLNTNAGQPQGEGLEAEGREHEHRDEADAVAEQHAEREQVTLANWLSPDPDSTGD